MSYTKKRKFLKKSKNRNIRKQENKKNINNMEEIMMHYINIANVLLNNIMKQNIIKHMIQG